jgi:hypothetical protein
MIELSQSRNQPVIVAGLAGHPWSTLNGLGVLDRVPDELRFGHREEAIRAAVKLARQIE